MRIWSLIFVLILANVLIYSTIYYFLFSRDFVAFPNIGQGSAVIIKDGKNVFLYDVGKENLLLLNSLKSNLPFYQKLIDIVIISHPDRDHYLNLLTLLTKYKIRLIAINQFALDDEKFRHLILRLKQKNQKIIFLDDKDIIKTKNLQAQIIHPERRYSSDNNNSLVIFLRIKNKTFLLTGDIEKEGILSLQRRYFLRNVDFLLYPHHGSKFSLEENFYKKLNPKIVIIQSGYNNFGHPHKEVLEFFKKLKIKIWETDLKGELKIEL